MSHYALNKFIVSIHRLSNIKLYHVSGGYIQQGQGTVLPICVVKLNPKVLPGVVAGYLEHRGFFQLQLQQQLQRNQIQSQAGAGAMGAAAASLLHQSLAQQQLQQQPYMAGYLSGTAIAGAGGTGYEFSNNFFHRVRNVIKLCSYYSSPALGSLASSASVPPMGPSHLHAKVQTRTSSI